MMQVRCSVATHNLSALFQNFKGVYDGRLSGKFQRFLDYQSVAMELSSSLCSYLCIFITTYSSASDV